MTDATAVVTEPRLTADVLAHLTAQLESARRMAAIVTEQGGAIRQRRTGQVVRLAGALQAEMHRREVIEIERCKLMDRAAAVLGLPADAIDMRSLTQLMDGDSARAAVELSTELRKLLKQIDRDHRTNRALMQQELAFLDHLLRLAGNGGGYGAAGERRTAGRQARMLRRPVIELEA